VLSQFCCSPRASITGHKDCAALIYFAATRLLLNAGPIRTYERYEQLVRVHIVPALGRVQLQKLTAQQVQNFYTKVGKQLSSTTVNTLHMMLHKALEDAVKWGLLARNVCDAVSAPQRAHYEIKPLTLEQAQLLLEAAKGDSLEALWVLALTTGIRRGEVLALKWQDINFEQSMLQVKRIFTRASGNRYIESEPKTEKSKRSITDRCTEM